MHCWCMCEFQVQFGSGTVTEQGVTILQTKQNKKMSDYQKYKEYNNLYIYMTLIYFIFMPGTELCVSPLPGRLLCHWAM